MKKEKDLIFKERNVHFRRLLKRDMFPVPLAWLLELSDKGLLDITATRGSVSMVLTLGAKKAPARRKKK